MGGRRQELVTEAMRLILQQDIDQYNVRYGPGINYIVPERVLLLPEPREDSYASLFG